MDEGLEEETVWEGSHTGSVGLTGGTGIHGCLSGVSVFQDVLETFLI